MFQRPTSLRSAFLLATAVTIIPILAINLFHAGSLRNRIAEEQRAAAFNLAQQTAASVGRDFEGTRQLLTALAYHEPIRQLQLEHAERVLRELRPTSPLFANLILIDRTGEIVASARAMPHTVNVADRSYFRRMQANRRIGIGDYMVGRITGRASVPVACPVPGQPETGPLNCVVAALDLDEIGRSLDQYRLPPETDLVLLDRSGTVIASRGTAFPARGQPLPTWVGAPRDHRFERNTPEGHGQIVHIAEVPSTDGAIWVGIAQFESALSRSAQLAFSLHLGLATLLVLAALVASAWIAQRWFLEPARRISRAAAALESGNWSARAGLERGAAELRSLGTTFDRLAAHLQRELGPRPESHLSPPIDHTTGPTAPPADRLESALEAQRHADSALRHSEATARAFIDSLPESALLLDPGGRVLMANPTVAARLRHPLSALIGRNIFSLMPPEAAAHRTGPLATVLASKQSFAFEDERDDHILHTQLTPVLDAAGEVAAVAVVSFDITERRHTEDQLRRSVAELAKALAEVKTLSGLIPICAGCKRIRDDHGYWNNVEQYIRAHAEVEFSHGLCPDCMRRLYPELADEIADAPTPPPTRAAPEPARDRAAEP